MGYVWCDGYVWDMCGVRYANNLLKKPATKRLSGNNIKLDNEKNKHKRLLGLARNEDKLNENG